MMDSWVSKVGDCSIDKVISASMAYRWDSRCSPSRKRQVASRCVRTASSRMAQRNRKIMKQFGECSLHRIVVQNNSRYVTTGLFHWVLSLHQHRDRDWSIILLYLCLVKLSLSSTRTNLSRLMQIRMASVSRLLAVRCDPSLFYV
jgi:hypothetical protein